MKTHDYTISTWGHDVMWDVLPDDRLKLTGWGYGIKPGDYIILSNAGNSTRYKIDEITYRSDPRDMWSAVASFHPRGEK